MRVAVVRLGMASDPVFELLDFLAMTFSKSARFVLDLAPKVVDLVVEALPSSLSADAN